jgi:hypothetical protein
MNLDEPVVQQLKKRNLILKFATEAEFTTPYKKLSYRIFSLFTPWFLLVYFFYVFLAKVSGKKQKWYSKFILYFFTRYFKYKGMSCVIEVESCDKILNHQGMAVFTHRMHPFQALYIYVQFKGNIVIPLDPVLQHYTFRGFKKWHAFKPLFEAISYPDQELKDNYNTLHQLLSEKKQVLVYLNQGNIDPFYKRSLIIYEESLFLYTTFSSSFLLMKGFEFFPIASILNPYLVTQHLKLKEELFKKETPVLGQLNALIKFFDFTHVMLKKAENVYKST